MKRKLSTYLELFGYERISFVNFDDVIWKAYKDGVAELVLSQEELDTIDRYFLVNGGQYDWKEKTIAGIKLIVE